MHPVIELILNRAATNSLPLHRNDPHQLALVVEGGGMRGVVSAGMLVGLDALGLLNYFDGIYGASAGAANAAYFLAGQAAFGTTIYYEDINNRAFIDFSRLLRGRPIANPDFVVYEVFGARKLLNWQAIISSPIPLCILATATSVEKPDDDLLHIFTSFRSLDDILHALRASINLAAPWVGGGPVGAKRFIDASVHQGIPLETAKLDGSTHILVLLTRPQGVAPRIGLIDRLFVASQIAHYSHDPAIGQRLKALYLTRYERYAKVISEIEAAEARPDGEPYICSVRLPNTGVRVSQLETRHSKLVAAAAQGMQCTLERFGQPGALITEQLSAYRADGSPIPKVGKGG